MSKSAEPKTEYGTINLWTWCPEAKEFGFVFYYISKLFLYVKKLEKERGKILCSSEDSHFPSENKEDY